jgi:carbonic anhydrase/acetyltransferase-like protein (isoleucine patch superfamily)
MNERLLRSLGRMLIGVPSSSRVVLLGLMGLNVGRDVIVTWRIRWPWSSLRQITLGDSVALGPNGWFFIPADNRAARISIGRGSAIGEGFVISSNNRIEIGENCLLSFRVSVLDHDHITGLGVNPVTSGITKGEPIKIGDNTFIGCNSVILRGVSLGRNCVVGANSVVTQSFEDSSVLAGAPAKLIRKLSN